MHIVVSHSGDLFSLDRLLVDIVFVASNAPESAALNTHMLYDFVGGFGLLCRRGLHVIGVQFVCSK